MSRQNRQWVSEAGESLSEVLARLSVTQEAIARGTVFVDGVRVAVGAEQQSLAVGQTVTVAEERVPVSDPVILYRRAGLIVVAKPAGLSTEPDRRGNRSLIHWLEGTISTESLHAHGRLDVGVSGAVLFTEPGPSRTQVERVKASGGLARTYLALALPGPQLASGTWDAPIGRGPRGRFVAGGREQRPARTGFRVLDRCPGADGAAWLELRPETGRTHQLRIHAASAGAPLLGDREYSGQTRVVSSDGAVQSLTRVALHAAKIKLPKTLGDMVVAAPLPECFELWWRCLGGTSPLDTP